MTLDKATKQLIQRGILLDQFIIANSDAFDALAAQSPLLEKLLEIQRVFLDHEFDGVVKIPNMIPGNPPRELDL